MSPARTPRSPAKKRGAAAPRRAPGRPGGADAADQQARLLDAALDCFVRQGVAATRLRDIAVQAGVTPALVNYYFGDKEQLLQTLVAQRLLPAVALLGQRLAQAGEDVEATVQAFVAGIFDIVEHHPWWPQLWVREVLCEGGALRDLLMSEVAPTTARLMVARFTAAQARGEIHPALDPRLLMTSLIGLTLFPIAGAPIWRAALGAQDLDAAAIARHALALLRHGMTPP
ncbi:TetR family transcriptional regulator [Stenotrophomonas panacihumi]|uniref:TetR family transcriptional regulator n=1 Tax=Stenotrophomonas panacihumi TaxID=676599 RepID=A0A0R0ADS5_9GAMM|nr:TetR/AcrR family transcriptional regulator [Stenotrophomonas panacihumi]KRG38899.1 TetR family transcriptional regulator [Stenotrophomonas panacihumi]PTN53018.1 TetR family transcriptional regulator [Stenotrophomonas panacihumi]